MDKDRFFEVLSFVFIGVCSRWVPHPPGFTSLGAMALFGPFCLGGRRFVFVALFSALFLSDLVLGFHRTMPFVYLAFALIVFLGGGLKKKRSLQAISLFSLCSPILFFFLTNFGVWLMGDLYPKTWEGLGLCYVAAVPFLLNQIAGDLVYGVIFFAMAHKLREHRVNEVKFMKKLKIRVFKGA